MSLNRFKYFRIKLSKIFSTVCLYLLASGVHAQFYEPNQSIIQVNKNPVSPTASALGNFGDFTVDYFSGSAGTQLKLANLEIDGFNLPVTLNYSPNGVKVMSTSSWVGTGWSLSAGGVIKRDVNDKPDDVFSKQYFSSGWGGAYQFSVGYSFLKLLNDNWNTMPNPNVTTTKTAYDVLSEIEEADNAANAWRIYNLRERVSGAVAINLPQGANIPPEALTWTFKGYDTEPDNFGFNFLGMSGNFFITPDQEVLKVPYNDLKFQLIYDDPGANIYSPAGFSLLKSIIITDEKGIKYYFDKKEVSFANHTSYEYNLNTPYRDPSLLGGSKNSSAWFISKIVLQNNEEFFFTYVMENQEPPYVFRSQSIRNSPDADGNASSNASTHQDNRPQHSLATTSLLHATHRLTSIESRLWKVNFNATHNREDLEGGAALTSIEIFSKGNELVLVKKWQFNYRYHDCKTTYQVLDYPKPSAYSSTGNQFKRLFLDKVSEISGSNSNQEYGFTYYENEPLPSPSSAEQDFWGFYNGNQAKTLMPKIGIYHDQALGYKKYSVYHKPFYNSPTPLFELPGADRTPNSYYSQLGTIKSIKYPTKGELTFEYESNEYELEGTTYLGPGIRVKRTTVYDGINHANDIVKDYRYYKPTDPQKSSGVLFNFPAFAYLENTHDYLAPYVLIGNGPSYYLTKHTVGFPVDYPVQDIRKYQYFLSRLDNPQYINSGINGADVGYRYVTEITNNKYKTVYHFSCPSSFGAMDDPLSDEDASLGGGGDLLFQAPNNFACRAPGSYGWSTTSGWIYNSQLDLAPNLSNMDINQPYSYPFAPTLNYDWNRGLLLEKIDYDENSFKVRQTTRKYKLFTPGNSSPKYINAFKVGYSDNFGCSPLNPNTGLPNNSLRNIYIGSKYKRIGGLIKLPEWEEVKTFVNNGSESITIKYDFKYQNNSTLTNEISYYDSKSGFKKTVNKYAVDFATGGNIYTEMLNRNMISPIIEQIEFVNNQENKHSFLSFNYFNTTQVLPELLRSSVNANPLEDRTRFVLYSSKGRLQEQKKEADISQSYIWGYNNSYIVAVINGMSYNDAVTQSGINLNILNNPSDETTMRTELNKLRSLSNTLVTTYTYRPFIGITSETDQSGTTIYYEYDEFNRLKLIKDQNNNILKKICYNYAGQAETCLNCLNFQPVWQNTETPIRCQVNSAGQNTGYQEQEQKDMNPCSGLFGWTRWVQLAQNTIACPVTSNVTLSSFNNLGLSDFYAQYVNNATSQTYTFSVSTSTDWGVTLGSIPAGTYTLTIYRPGNSYNMIYGSGCSGAAQEAVVGVFYNVAVSPTNCNLIVIDIP